MVDFDERENEEREQAKKMKEMLGKALSKWAENEEKLQEKLDKPIQNELCCMPREVYYHLDLHLNKEQLLKVIEAIEPTTTLEEKS